MYISEIEGSFKDMFPCRNTESTTFCIQIFVMCILTFSGNYYFLPVHTQTNIITNFCVLKSNKVQEKLDDTLVK